MFSFARGNCGLYLANKIVRFQTPKTNPITQKNGRYRIEFDFFGTGGIEIGRTQPKFGLRKHRCIISLHGKLLYFSRAAWNLFDVGNRSVPTHLANNIPLGWFQCTLEWVKTRPQSYTTSFSRAYAISNRAYVGKYFRTRQWHRNAVTSVRFASCGYSRSVLPVCLVPFPAIITLQKQRAVLQ